MGRPSIYEQAIADAILERMVSDPPESLRQICSDEAMPGRTTVFRWISEHEDFRNQYMCAREAQADCYRDQGDEISAKIDSPEKAQIARVQLDWIKWNAARMAPKKYGEKVEQFISGPEGGPIQSAITVHFVKPATDGN